MPGPKHKVTLVLDFAFGQKLHLLATESHLWVIDPPIDRIAASEYWAKNSENKVESGIMTFKVSENEDTSEICLRILGTIDLHHNEYSSTSPYSVLEIIGLNFSDELESAIEDLGFKKFETTDKGFRAYL